MTDKASKEGKAEETTQPQNREEIKEKKETTAPTPSKSTLPQGVFEYLK